MLQLTPMEELPKGAPRTCSQLVPMYQLGLRVETFDSHTFLKASELQMLSCYLPLTGLLAAPNPLHRLPDSDTHPLGGKHFPSGAARSRQALAVDGAHPGEQVWDANLTLVLGTRSCSAQGCRRDLPHLSTGEQPYSWYHWHGDSPSSRDVSTISREARSFLPLGWVYS